MKSRPLSVLPILTAFLLALPVAAQEESAGDEEAIQEAAAGEKEGAKKKPHKAGYEKKAVFGGPNTPGGQLEEDDQVKEPAFRFPAFDRTMGRWFDWKRRVNEEHDRRAGLAAALSRSPTSSGAGPRRWSRRGRRPGAPIRAFDIDTDSGGSSGHGHGYGDGHGLRVGWAQ